jgi:purine-binding chemotaxis protein CheW
MKTLDNTYLLSRVEETHIAIPAHQILHIGDLPYLTRIPRTPKAVAGVMNLRGNVIPVVDIRTFFGLPTLRSEVQGFRLMLEKRRQDHLDWLNELELCVKENKAFTLARNAHDCEFGHWYDGFSTQNKTLELLVKRFDAPHKAVHAVANDVLKLHEEGQSEEALSMIQETKDTHLARLNSVFDVVIEHYEDANKELVVIIRSEPYRVGFIVDAVNSVESFKQDQVEDVKGIDLEHHIAEYAEKAFKKENEIYYGILPERLIPVLFEVEETAQDIIA